MIHYWQTMSIKILTLLMITVNQGNTPLLSVHMQVYFILIGHFHVSLNYHLIILVRYVIGHWWSAWCLECHTDLLLLLLEETAEISALICLLNHFFFEKFHNSIYFLPGTLHITKRLLNDSLDSIFTNFNLKFLENSFSCLLNFHALAVKFNL